MATAIAFLSLLLSIFVYFLSRNHNKKNEELIRHEIELIRVQLQKERKGAKDELKANVSARMFNVGKNNWKISYEENGTGSKCRFTRLCSYAK